MVILYHFFKNTSISNLVIFLIILYNTNMSTLTNLGRSPILEVGKVSRPTFQISTNFHDFSSLIVNPFFKLIFSFANNC